MFPSRMLNKREVAALVGISASTIDREIARGCFPQPIRLSARRVGWTEQVILEWQRQQGMPPQRQVASKPERDTRVRSKRKKLRPESRRSLSKLRELASMTDLRRPVMLAAAKIDRQK